MKTETYNELGRAMGALKAFNNKYEEDRHRFGMSQVPEAIKVMHQAHDAIEAVFTPTHEPNTEALQAHLLLGTQLTDKLAEDQTVPQMNALLEWARDAGPLLPKKRKFNVYIKLHGEYEAYEAYEAAALAEDEIAMREGMDVVDQWVRER